LDLPVSVIAAFLHGVHRAAGLILIPHPRGGNSGSPAHAAGRASFRAEYAHGSLAANPSEGITHERVTTPEGRPNRLKPSTVQTILTWEGSMSSSTAAPATGRGGRYAAREGYGLIIFASILLLVLSFFNLIDGIAAVANSHVFTANAHYVFGDLRTWGWITLIVGVLQLLAAGGILAGNQLARWFAVALVGLNAIDQMFFIPAYPFWSLTIIAVDVVVLWGLCVYGSRENLAS
jgi:hypothetical protein